jgi:hypothetical protein
MVVDHIFYISLEVFMKTINKIALIFFALLFVSIGVVFAGEKNGVVTTRTTTVDNKGNTDIRIYLDTTGNGVADTVLGYQKEIKQKEDTAVIEDLDALIRDGSHLVFDDTNATRPDGFVRIIWHDLITVDSISLAQRFPNPYWFPFAYAKANN